jgi:cupin superfamily acireductone dioxygenase involved in methionine salvage
MYLDLLEMEKTAREMRVSLKEKIVRVLRLYGYKNLDVILVSGCLNLGKPSF